jgi:hypothetical protein
MMDHKIAARFGLLYIQIDHLRAAHHLAEDALNRHDEGIDKWYEEQLEQLQSTDPDDEEYLAYLHSEQKAEAADAYPNILRSALFATGYAVLEFFMTSLCKDLEPQIKGPRLRDLRGDGIRRAKLYLESVASVPIPDSPEWQDLIAYGLLRNALVHSLGDLSTNDQRQTIEQLEKRVGTFKVAADTASVTLTKEFNPLFLNTVDAFASHTNAALGK